MLVGKFAVYVAFDIPASIYEYLALKRSERYGREKVQAAKGFGQKRDEKKHFIIGFRRHRYK